MENELLPAILFSALSLACIIIIMYGLRKALYKTGWDKKLQQRMFSGTLVAIAAWVVILSGLAIAGFFRNFSLPPRPALAILLPVFAILILSYSKRFTALLKTMPPQWPVLLQSFRIVVEILLWLAFTRGLLPRQMTFEGNNFDMLSGILGLFTGWVILQNKSWWKMAVAIYNITGLVLLLNILVIAVLSMTTPIRYFMNEPANTIIAEFPFIYLPGILVVIAAGLHIISLRQLSVAAKKEVKI
jgi:hypothetical protein